MNYFWFRAFHIVGIVAWFAGLFYLPRLFVYHAEAYEQPEPAQSILKNQYQIMEKRLYSIIMTPAMLLTVVMRAIAITGYRARIRNHGHSCFLCEIVIRSQFHTTYEPEA
jgi:Predicted membrane protein